MTTANDITNSLTMTFARHETLLDTPADAALYREHVVDMCFEWSGERDITCVTSDHHSGWDDAPFVGLNVKFTADDAEIRILLAFNGEQAIFGAVCENKQTGTETTTDKISDLFRWMRRLEEVASNPEALRH